MRKKFTMLFAALLACVGVAKAAVTDLPQMSTEGDIKWYTIKNVRQQKFATYAGDKATMTQQATASAASFFYFTASATESAVKIHNFSAGEKLCAAYNSWTATGIDWYLKAQATGVSICTSTGEWNAWNDAGGGGQKVEYWSASDAGSAWEISLVTDFSSIIDVPAAKESAKTTLNALKNITELFSETAIVDAVAKVEAVEPASNGLADLNAAIVAIDAVVAEAYALVDGKNVRFTSYGRDGSVGHDLTAVAAGANGTKNSADAGIWTLKDNGDGTFKMYNFVSDLYLGATTGNSNGVATCSAFADAAPYTFNPIAENKTNLWNKGNTLHLDSWANVVQWNPDNTTAQASIWSVVSCDPITVTREQYVAAAAAKESLPHAIQEAYGLVKDATKYTSNAPETDPNEHSSYDNLLDNNYESYFHSSWSYAVGAHHYLQAEVSEEVESFYFYFKKRKQNENNRPTEIEILGSTDGENYTIPVATISEGLPTTAGTIDYFSAKITATESVKYLRFVVKGTNNGASHKDDEGHPFFTFSEFYILPAVADVTNLINSYKAFASSSITSEDMATAATALISAETTLALANIKKEVAALLSANESNHAATPELGQYTTEAYDALNAAYEAADATQESLEAAIAAFKASKNLPVFTITGVKDYVVGKSIYDNNSGTLYFKATNLYDKSMWWAFDQTTTTVGVTEEVAVTNVATGKGFWGASSIKVTETSENEGAGIVDDNIFLFYTTGNNTPVHFQNDNQQIVRWNSTEATSGSAAMFTYIGNTYDLNKLTDEYFAAANELAAINVPNFNFAAGVNNYDVTTKSALDEAVANRTTVLSTLSSTAEDIAAAKAQLEEAIDGVQINMPVNGKFYRVRCAGNGMKYLQSTLDSSNESDVRLQVLSAATSVNATFCYVDGALLSYTTGLYINAYRFNEVGTKSDVVFSEASNGKVGAYNITVGGRYIFGAQDNNKIDSGSGTPDDRDGYTWWLEEVSELPVTITSAGYATFFAPVEVTLPAEGITAHTITEDEDGIHAVLSEPISVVPANNGVLLAGEEGTYNLTITNTEAADLENALKGTAAKTLVTKTEGDAYYVLAKKNDVVGLYNPVNGADKTTFYNAGFRAYWHIAGAPQGAGYRIGEEEDTTAIDQLLNTNGELVIYDLSGRRVQKMEKGIYIVNGKKVVK